MNMTEEQKAFYFYGQNRAILSYQILRIRETLSDVGAMKYKDVPLKDRREICNIMQISTLIQLVRQRLVVCRQYSKKLEKTETE